MIAFYQDRQKLCDNLETEGHTALGHAHSWTPGSFYWRFLAFSLPPDCLAFRCLQIIRLATTKIFESCFFRLFQFLTEVVRVDHLLEGSLSFTGVRLCDAH